MTELATLTFWQTMSDAPHAFVGLCGEEFHARPLKVTLEPDSMQLWVMLPCNSAMARRLHLNSSAFLVVNNREGTFSGKVFGTLMASDDDVSRRRLLRNSHAPLGKLHDCILARFQPEKGEAWLGPALLAAKLTFDAATDFALPSATVFRFEEAKRRMMSRAAE